MARGQVVLLRFAAGFLYEQLQYPVTAELYVDKVDRDGYRTLCDSCVKRSEISMLPRLHPSAHFLASQDELPSLARPDDVSE